MAALVWVVTWLLQVLPVLSELPPPAILTLNSSHFTHILTWEPGPGSPPGVFYRVAVITETGASWSPVIGCERVQHPLVCNLTQAFSDHNQVYLTRVTAVLDAQTSHAVADRRFQPIKDTHLDLPLLSVTPCERNLCVDLQPPQEDLREVYQSLHYQLRVQTDSAERVQDVKFLRRETLDNLAPGRRYCVAIRFSDSLVLRMSHYSRPVCAVTAASYSADVLISAVLCLLVLLGLAAVPLLVAAGYICLRRRPLPRVLTSVHHIDGPLVLPPFTTSLSTLWNVKPIPPPYGKQGSYQALTDEHDGEEVSGSAAVRGGGHYPITVDLDLLLPSSSSPPCFSAPSLPEPEPVGSCSSGRTSGSPDPPPTAAAGRTLIYDSLPESDHQVWDPPADALTGGGIQPHEEEEEEVGDGAGQDVNLLTLTFGRHDDEEEKEGSHDGGSCASEDAGSVLPTEAWETEETLLEMVSCSANEEEEEEEEEEETSGYIGHPHIVRNSS